jgi:NADH-quinone oxidoreductase subunit N
MQTFPDLWPALPELVLAGGGLVLVLIGAIAGERSYNLVTGIALALLAAAFVFLLAGPSDLPPTFNGGFTLDAFARFMKMLTVIGAFAALMMSITYLREARLQRFEFPILVVLATVGMLMMISATDLIALYLGLELHSLALYVIAAFHRDSVRSTEAGLKYFVLGALSSGMLLYGASLVYGYSGTIAFSGIAASVAAGPVSIGLLFGLVFVLAGLAFKIAAVPFHMWTPDVYEGSPTPVTAFFSAAPKLAAMALFVRVVSEAFPGIATEWRQIVTFIAIASMVLGAFAAIGQRNIKRLMAYSSIGHMGYALVGLAAASPAGVQGVVIYLTIYLAMTLGAFACILSMRTADGMVENVDDLAGLAKTRPGMAFLLAMILFSLAGIPPLAGFFAKLYVFLAAMEAHLYGLAVIGVLASVVGAYYYLRIVKLMYFDEPRVTFEPMPRELGVVLALSGFFVLFYVFYPAPLTEAAAAAAQSLF